MAAGENPVDPYFSPYQSEPEYPKPSEPRESRLVGIFIELDNEQVSRFLSKGSRGSIRLSL